MRVRSLLVLETLALAPLLAQPLPQPALVYRGSADNGAHFIQYNLAVTNYEEFSDELFQAAPDLPPCGLNRSAARTWVEIFDDGGQRIYGFCAIQTAAELQKLWFALPADRRPPKWIRVRIEDRRTRRSAEARLTLPRA